MQAPERIWLHPTIATVQTTYIGQIHVTKGTDRVFGTTALFPEEYSIFQGIATEDKSIDL